MPDSDITCADLAITPGIGHNLARWTVTDPNDNGLFSLRLAAVELWAATTNDRSLATKITGEGRDNLPHMALLEGASYYYWVKARNNSGYYGDWFPSGATSGVEGVVGFSVTSGLAVTNGKMVPSVGSNALTITLQTLAGAAPSATTPLFLAFRNATLASGAPEVLSVTSALSLVISSGSTLGTSSATPFRVWVLAINDAGTVRLGAIVCTTANSVYTLDETRLISSTAEGGAGAADSAGVIYTGTAVSSKPFRILGFLTWNSGLATAGTWSAMPDVTQVFGAGVKKPGEVIQNVYNFTGGVISGSTQVVLDDTIPQSNEGSEFFSTSITPSSSANLLVHNSIMNFETSSPGTGMNLAALFRNAETNAIAASWIWPVADFFQIILGHRHIANSTSAQTFKIRAGQQDAIATVTLNGASGGRLLGGALSSGHSIDELMG